jgi:hypothetical protein
MGLVQASVDERGPATPYGMAGCGPSRPLLVGEEEIIEESSGL